MNVETYDDVMCAPMWESHAKFLREREKEKIRRVTNDERATTPIRQTLNHERFSPIQVANYLCERQLDSQAGTSAASDANPHLQRSDEEIQKLGSNDDLLEESNLNFTSPAEQLPSAVNLFPGNSKATLKFDGQKFHIEVNGICYKNYPGLHASFSNQIITVQLNGLVHPDTNTETYTFKFPRQNKFNVENNITLKPESKT